ncbi:uncharacterized protein LOC114341129 [Diabrotica virgifera virgifera]|uniref:Partial AB-hydrolase lipase domain-containing protein n=1 Tax=Diabrotica virgifera virgifera TaxID=50390 RepID=A0ABM5L309_DIAVI|nr:uncharacterized protein LOC114341129 [Diabrotica virgifera virgifera]
MQRSKLFKWSTIIIICIIARLILLWIPQKNNVCSTLSAYFNINNNDNCWHNPDKGLSVVEIISKYGYNFEEHIVISEDGYRLFVYRILPKGNSSFNQPLLLMPGMGGSPEFWLLQGAESIIFLLADKGYDVWLSAVRGTVDYDEELKKFKDEEDYWNFSFHEIGIYDLPALTDYVTKRTKSKVIFVGHSMGSTASYVYAIEKKTHAERNLKGLVSLGPAAYMGHTQGFFKFIGPKNEWVWDFTKKIGCYAVSNTYTKRWITSLLCSQYPGVLGCYYFYGYMSGLSPSEERPDMVPLFFSVMPSPISMRTLAHFGQLIETTRFQKFDYRDDQINLEKYGSLKPPDYNISQISLPVQLFTGTYDFSSSDKDVDILYQQLKKNGVKTSKYVFPFAHADYLMGRNYKEFYKSLLRAIRELHSKHKMKLVTRLTVLYVVVKYVSCTENKNNVCTNLLDYKNLQTSKNCYYNPNLKASTKEIFQRYGYTYEVHYLKTQDGYMVKLERLGTDEINKKWKGDRQPVLLQGGVGAAPQFWILRGEDGLAFQLFDSGYDVWISSIRGSFPEAKNEKYEKRDPRYWDYTFHEVAIYDIPKMTEYIAEKTDKKKKIIYVGHSMGTSISFVYAIERKEHAEKYLRGIVSLSPVAFLNHAEPAIRLLAKFESIAFSVLQALGIYALGEPPILRVLIFQICSHFPTIIICDALNGRWIGSLPTKERADLVPVFFSFFPQPTSWKSFKHYAQIINSGQFQKYDFGLTGNMKIYKQVRPPKYNISNIALPVHFFLGTNDDLSTIKDNDQLMGILQKNGVTTSRRIYDEYAHNDVFLGTDYNKFASDVLNVVDILRESNEPIK